MEVNKKIFGRENILWIDKFEELLEGILEGLKARKNIQPLNEEIKNLRDENSKLQRELDAANSTVENLRGDVKKISAERDDLERQLKNLRDDFDVQEKNLRADFNRQLDDVNKNLDNANKTISDLQRDLDRATYTANFYRQSYSGLDKIYKLYLTLDEDTRYNLAGIFGAGDTATGFLSGAVQESHIDSLWDYIARHNDETLQKIFDFAFEMYNKGFRDAPYTRLDISQGDYYDDEFMRRTPSSPQLGKVNRVLFQGYKYSTGNVIKPSIVELI